MKTRICYLPLEPLKARYTELLSRPGGWVEQAFDPTFDVKALRPTSDKIPLSVNIATGEVLDSINRPLWALEQIQMWLQEPTYQTSITYVDDFFHPGLEAIPYSRKPARVYSYCWAQSFDKFDFTRKMIKWMRPYERMAFEIYDGVFVANELLADLIITALPEMSSKVHVVGLPFNSADVASQLDISYEVEEYDVVYSSRLDTEKNPNLFLDIVEACPNIKFALLTGHDEVRGNDTRAVQRINAMAGMQKNLGVHTKLTKGEYYAYLNKAKVQLNTASQDWVSFTLLEALTFDCIPVYPMTRSFIETLADPGHPFLYSAGNIDSAIDMIQAALNTDNHLTPKTEILGYHDMTLNRIGNKIWHQ